MYFFLSDYSQGAHPKVLKVLQDTNFEHTDGYGCDEHCKHAAEMIRNLSGLKDASVHMMVGGTSCNITAIAAALRPYESVISVRTGHIYVHETGAIEATGHRIVAMDGVDGKLTPELIDKAWEEFEDEHTPLPKMAYISQPTESGTLYSKAEIECLKAKCDERDMLFYIDGARLGSALAAKGNDLDLKTLASLCDAFYLGGTKNGALFGEALVISNKEMDDHFRFMMKRQGGLLAKGRLIGVQFEALLEGGADSIYFEMARHANAMADIIRDGLERQGIVMHSESHTNQVFPILPIGLVEELKREFMFYEWAPAEDGMVTIRLVTAWGTKEEDVRYLLSEIERLNEAKGEH